MTAPEQGSPAPPSPPDQFDHLAPHMAITESFHEQLDAVRAAGGGVSWSDRHGGFWAITSYADVLRVAQDWENFSSEHGITVPSGGGKTPIPAIPEMVDPPLHREYKRLINRYFTPAVVLEHEDQTRVLVNRLVDEFIEAGECDFMSAFANPLPGLVFFDMFLHAPAEELDEINRLASTASVPTTPEAREARGDMIRWIFGFVEQRKQEPPRGDVVDAILTAEIDGRPIAPEEVVGIIQLLLFGGLDTTAGALGTAIMRLAEDPSLQTSLRSDPDRIPEVIEELIRLDGPFAFIGRCAMNDVEVGGKQIKKGDMVLLSWAAANRDEAEFACPATLDPERESNRHIAFGAGPHRCAGSNLARMNLQISLEELVRRLHDLRLATDEPIRFHAGYSRAPVSVPIRFAVGERED